MTLEEGIIHAEDVARMNHETAKYLTDEHPTQAEKCEACAKEHRQLAEWLKELKAKRKEAARERMRKYREEHPDKVKEIRKRHNDKVKAELRDNQFTVTKEEWKKRYGYEMGSTEGWENWLGWDNRIRRSEYDV